MAYQVRDRVSFMAFLGLSPGDDVPDEKTVWLFREPLTRLGLARALFEQFESDLSSSGFAASQGSIVDASIVQVPCQRNSPEDNQTIKVGYIPMSFVKNPCKQRQKDTDARWVSKYGRRWFGYKNHINVDVRHKLIRQYAVTGAATHDSQMIDQLLNDRNTSKAVFGDSAYRSKAISQRLEAQGYRDRIHRKGYQGHPLSEHDRQTNKTKSKIRARVEHVFGRQAQSLGGTLLRRIGLARARTAIGLRNLVYNLDCYARLVT